MVLTRGFTGRGGGARDLRLPPGKYDAGMDWPVLHVEPTPSIDTAGWSFEIDGLVDKPVRWSWEEIHALPASRYEGAIHCVTTWSKFGMQFDGVRLSAPDGYRAQRSYSIASAPSDSAEVDLTIEILPGGEVSGFLHEAVEVGDMLDVRGPIGGHFAWNLQPTLGVADGSGIGRLDRLHVRRPLRACSSTESSHGPAHRYSPGRGP